MKVYACPEEVPAPTVDYGNYDRAKVEAQEAEHKAALKAWLIEAGYDGPRTGEIFSIGMADGYANYMLADGRRSCLIHLPHGDGWDHPDVKFLPKKEILRRIDQRKGLRSIFAERASA